MVFIGFGCFSHFWSSLVGVNLLGISEKYIPGNKTISGYHFRYQLTCPLYTGVFLGNALQLFGDH